MTLRWPTKTGRWALEVSALRRGWGSDWRSVKKLDYKLKDIVLDDRLYGGEADNLLDVIHELDDKLDRVMLFGHNPGLTELAHRLSSEITHMPTSAVAEFTFDAKSWSNIGKVKPAKVALDYPKKS